MKQGGRQDGMSLMGAIIAVAVFAATAAMIMQRQTNSMKAQQHAALRASLTALKTTLQSSVDCQQTVSAIATTCNGVIPLLSATGATIHPSGKFTVRATCQAGQGLTIQAARLKPGAAMTTQNNADFYTDPLNGQPLSWANGTLFSPSSGTGLCQTLFSSTTSTSGCTAGTYACVNTPNYMTQTANLALYPSIPQCGLQGSSNYGYISYGTAMCPTGWRPVGGAVQCQYTYGSAEAGGAGQGGGDLLSMTFTGDGMGLFFVCCVAVNAGSMSDGTQISAGIGAGVVACIPAP